MHALQICHHFALQFFWSLQLNRPVIKHDPQKKQARGAVFRQLQQLPMTKLQTFISDSNELIKTIQLISYAHFVNLN